MYNLKEHVVCALIDQISQNRLYNVWQQLNEYLVSFGNDLIPGNDTSAFLLVFLDKLSVPITVGHVVNC